MTKETGNCHTAATEVGPALFFSLLIITVVLSLCCTWSQEVCMVALGVYKTYAWRRQQRWDLQLVPVLMAILYAV